MSKIEVNQISSQCGSTLTIGQSGDTVTLACGATAAGFGSTGEVSWDTTKKTTGFTATSGVGYFCDTTSAAFTVTLPATPSAGNVVAVSDYAGTFGTNNLTIGRNGSNINGSASDYVIYPNNTTAQFIYVDATEGWRLVFTGASSDLASNFIIATGGTITCCGDFKIHTFTGPGTFTVTNTGPGSSTVDYLVAAGGGGGGQNTPFGCFGAGAGGAGGFRESSGAASGCYSISPLGACVSALPVTAQDYPITVGAGGAGSPCAPGFRRGCNGSNSIFSTITSAGGGGGGSGNSGAAPINSGSNGGSGGGASCAGTGGSGNTPPVSPPQGNNGGSTSDGGGSGAAGGGGATAAGTDGSPGPGGPGGAGATTSISATPTAYAGGGGGGGRCGGGSGGTGGGGNGATTGGSNATNGTANTSGGGGGGSATDCHSGGSGGSGIVIIRYKYQ